MPALPTEHSKPLERGSAGVPKRRPHAPDLQRESISLPPSHPGSQSTANKVLGPRGNSFTWVAFWQDPYSCRNQHPPPHYPYSTESKWTLSSRVPLKFPANLKDSFLECLDMCLLPFSLPQNSSCRTLLRAQLVENWLQRNISRLKVKAFPYLISFLEV